MLIVALAPALEIQGLSGADSEKESDSINFTPIRILNISIN